MNDLKAKATALLIIVGVVGVGLFAINQALEFGYRSAFLQTPCQLCKELNPLIDESCFQDQRLYFQDDVSLNITFGGLENATQYRTINK